MTDEADQCCHSNTGFCYEGQENENYDTQHRDRMMVLIKVLTPIPARSGFSVLREQIASKRSVIEDDVPLVSGFGGLLENKPSLVHDAAANVYIFHRSCASQQRCRYPL